MRQEWEEDRGTCRVLVGKPEGRSPLATPRRRWEDGINTDRKEIWWEVMNWVHLARNRHCWRAVVNTVMSFRVPYNAGNFLATWGAVSLWERTPFFGIIQLICSSVCVVSNGVVHSEWYAVTVRPYERQQSGLSRYFTAKTVDKSLQMLTARRSVALHVWIQFHTYLYPIAQGSGLQQVPPYKHRIYGCT
jgi:hypothetical protein